MKITIITITYNAERWLEKTMRSVLGQTCKDYEYLIIDGASTDNTLEIVKRLEPAFEGRLIRQSEPDKGLYDAMNKGLARAKGEFVWFINAGDEIYAPETLAHVVAAATAETDIVYGKSCVINAADLQRNHLLNGLVVSHQAIIVRRQIAAPYDLQYRISADYDWVIKAVSVSRRNCYLDEPLCKFLTEGVSKKQRKRSWEERFVIMRRHFGLFRTLWAHFVIALKYPFSTKY